MVSRAVMVRNAMRYLPLKSRKAKERAMVSAKSQWADMMYTSLMPNPSTR